MSAVRAVTEAGSWSLSKGFKDYFACCFESPSAEKAAYLDSASKKSQELGSSSPKTERVRCTRRSDGSSDDDDEEEHKDPGAVPACDRRLEADGASVHSGGTDKSSGRKSGTAGELATRQSLDSSVASAHDESRPSSSDRTDVAGSAAEKRERSKSHGSDVSSGGARDDVTTQPQYATSQQQNDVTSTSQGTIKVNEPGAGVTEVDSIVAGHIDLNRSAEEDRAESTTGQIMHDGRNDSALANGKEEGRGSLIDVDEQRAGSLSGSEKLFADDEMPDQSAQPPKSPTNVRFATLPEEPLNLDESPTRRSGRSVSQCGRVRLGCRCEASGRRLMVTVHEAADLPNEDRGGASHTQVHVVLLPTKKVRHKTHIKPGTNPTFDETFEFRIQPDELNSMGFRLRLYGSERLRRERLIGECVVSFTALGLSTSSDQPVERWVALEPRSNLSLGDSLGQLAGDTVDGGSAGSLSTGGSDSASNLSMQHGGMPELMLGLMYNETTGRMSVEVIKGSNFKNMAATRPPDTSVKLALMSATGQEISRSKTSVRRGQPNPLFKETFMFQVPQFQLPDVSLMVSVYAIRTLKRKDMIGWFSMGLTNSSDEESAHWTSMRESHGDQVCRWHLLIEP